MEECMATELWAAIIGVAGTLIGVWIGARLSSNTAKNLVVQQVKAEFYSAFTETLVQLHARVEELDIGEARRILQVNFPSHLAAYLKLKASVPSKYVKGIEEAWGRYTNDNEYELQEEKDIYRFSHVMSGGSDEDMRRLAIEHVNALIESVRKT